MNNTQPERTTHHVMHRVIYFEAYDNVINGSKERFHQPDFEIYKHIQNIMPRMLRRFSLGEFNSSVRSVCCACYSMFIEKRLTYYMFIAKRLTNLA